MSAWANLFSLGRSLIKRPAVWLGGIFTAAMATYVTTNLLTPVQTFFAEKTAEKACQYRQTPISNDSQFIILVSPLDDDPDGSHTKKVMRAFTRENGFNVVQICDHLNFNLSTGSQTATDDVLKDASELIKARHADLILFGYVSEQGKAIVIYTYNEHGGCDRHPKPTKIEQGVLSDDFTAEEKEKLIEVSLKEIQSACLNQSSIDWPRFAKRMNKMEIFLNHFDFNHDKSLDVGGSYVLATSALYGNGQGDVWFSKGETFAKRIIDENHGNSKALSSIYTGYANLLSQKFCKTRDKNNLDAEFHALDKAIGLDPKNADAYNSRGWAYLSQGDTERAIEDSDKAIGLDPKLAAAYGTRGDAYLSKGKWDRAIKDYDKAIGLAPKLALAYRTRGHAYLVMGEWDRAIGDYAKAVGLDPKDAVAHNSRGRAYQANNEWDRAIEDYTQAIGLDPKFADAYYNRGVTYSLKSEWDRAIEDYTQAIGLDPYLASAYAGRGHAYQHKGDLDHANADYDKAIVVIRNQEDGAMTDLKRGAELKP